MKILIVLTSHEQLGNTDKKTGFWLEELAAPYYIFKDAGVNITLASPLGGKPPLDPQSDMAITQTEATHRFKADPIAMKALGQTQKLYEIDINNYDALFYPGGHGPLWDLAEDPTSIRLIEHAIKSGKPVAAVCHAPGVFRHVKDHEGKPLVNGKTVTGFTNTEEAAVGLSHVVPFLVEDMLIENGAHYSKADDWQVHVKIDGLLITGQNPASSAETAKSLLQILG